MSKNRRRKRKKLSSSSSFEGPSTVQDQEDEVSDSQKFAASMAEKIQHDGKTWAIDGKIFFKPDLTAKALRIDSYEDLKAL